MSRCSLLPLPCGRALAVTARTISCAGGRWQIEMRAVLERAKERTRRFSGSNSSDLLELSMSQIHSILYSYGDVSTAGFVRRTRPCAL